MSAAYYLMQSPETKELGDALAFGASLLFALVFGIRFAATGKVMPAGFLLAVSMSLTALTFSAYLQDKSMMYEDNLVNLCCCRRLQLLRKDDLMAAVSDTVIGTLFLKEFDEAGN
uniref:Protein fatty acid export 4, chloroplastic n=1 Tax=Tanacetum cinerariifolium TaxID=118510 RepID=A0A6L2NYJ5_TANCI|nr:protein fatty acid export 4, chloroplastic [Tanacetum cinerariifolium]